MRAKFHIVFLLRISDQNALVQGVLILGPDQRAAHWGYLLVARGTYMTARVLFVHTTPTMISFTSFYARSLHGLDSCPSHPLVASALLLLLRLRLRLWLLPRRRPFHIRHKVLEPNRPRVRRAALNARRSRIPMGCIASASASVPLGVDYGGVKNHALRIVPGAKALWLRAELRRVEVGAQ